MGRTQYFLKKNRQYLIVVLIIILAIFLLTNKLIIWGLIVFAAGLIVLGIHQLINLNVKVSQFQGNIDALDEKNSELLQQNLKLKEENNFLKDRHFQITQIRSILELNPKFLSFGNRKLEWDFFEILEYKNIIPLTGKRWMTCD
ncbi:MAG TPA: hypothetical protein DDW27_21085, partial [Bacteroidales bacterium]|nr:hypothetical protein [Bacteroidales bacterium]